MYNVMYQFANCAIDGSGERWNVTNIVDHTKLGSPDRLEANQAMTQSSSINQDKSTTVRRLEQQLQECHLNEELQRRVAEMEALTTAAQDFQQQAQESNRRVEESNRRAKDAITKPQESNRN